jgi:polyphosphate kinase
VSHWPLCLFKVGFWSRYGYPIRRAASGLPWRTASAGPLVSQLVTDDLRPALAADSISILEYAALNKKQIKRMQRYFKNSVEPILTPIAVDVSHPFPFISNLGLNLAVVVTEKKRKGNRFIQIWWT